MGAQPSVSRAFPPVGWHRTLAQEPHKTTDCACENTVVIAKQPTGRQKYKYNVSEGRQ